MAEPPTLDVWCFGRSGRHPHRRARGLTLRLHPGWLAAAWPPLSQSLPLDRRVRSGRSCRVLRWPASRGHAAETARPAARRQRPTTTSASLRPSAATPRAPSPWSCRRGRAPGPPGLRRRVARRRGARQLEIHDSRCARCTPTRTASTASRSLGLRTSFRSSSGPTAAIGLTKGRRAVDPHPQDADRRASRAHRRQRGPVPGPRPRAGHPHGLGDAAGTSATPSPPRPALRPGGAGGWGGRPRLHQEDFCQALGIPTVPQVRGGGGDRLLADSFTLAANRATEALPASGEVRRRDRAELPCRQPRRPWQVTTRCCTARTAFGRRCPPTTCSARSAYRGRDACPQDGDAHRWPVPARLCRAATSRPPVGRGGSRLRRRAPPSARACASGAHAARKVRRELAIDGWDAPILDTVIEIVDKRSGWLTDLATSSRVLAR